VWLRSLASLTVLSLLLASAAATGAAPTIFRTPDYESPVQGGPDDLVFLGGLGLSVDDRVVYQAERSGPDPMSNQHPKTVPVESTPDLGIAPIVKLGDPPYSLTVRLPKEVSSDVVYRLWVVNSASEWSAPARINDPRPMWMSPAYVYATSDFAGLQRRIRVMGRNLQLEGSAPPLRIRLKGPETYTLMAGASAGTKPVVLKYVAEASLPARAAPGSYIVSVSRNGRDWTDVLDQKFSVLPDPPPLPTLSITDNRFGTCRPGDGSDDSGCLAKAIEAARQAGGGVVMIPSGTWDLSPVSRGDPEAEFVLPEHVQLRGAGAGTTTLRRRADHDKASAAVALLLLEGDDSVTGIKFADEEEFTSFEGSRPMIKLGHRPTAARPQDGAARRSVRRIVITQNVFRGVGIPIIDSGLPIEQLFVTHNDFGGYARGLELPGSGTVDNPFRIDDTVIRWNRFVPGSYIDTSIGQGVIATGLGASRRVDFSSNEADGSATDALQAPGDPPGWRAGFFWNMHNNGELILVADNRISCSGDKAGDGEGIAFDANGFTFGFPQAADVTGGDASSVSVKGDLESRQYGQPIDRGSYYVGHWVQLVAGPGLGQTRRIQSYRVNPGGSEVVFQVTPAWDVAPVAGQTRVIVTTQFWQVHVIGNEITQAVPPCRKANPNKPSGGEINLWAPMVDSVVDSNRQIDTSGIGFTQGYSAKTPSCPTCTDHATFQTALEIRGNLIDGEYDWSSDCSWSGIYATFGASPTPEAPPPIMSFGVQILNNTIAHADGLRGGGIDVVPTWHEGPDPRRWPLIDNLILAHNTLRDLGGPAPRPACKYGQTVRAGIRIEGTQNIRNTVLFGNTCERVAIPLSDSGVGTARVCDSSGAAHSCECGPAQP
jgi:hypothetical protein